MSGHIRQLVLPLALLFAPMACASPADPSQPPPAAHGATETFALTDAERARTLPVRIVLPETTAPAPVVIYSHGLGGNLDVAGYLVDYWARSGYVVVVIQHPGSDDSVWEGKGPGAAMKALKQAANAENYVARLEDVHFVLDQLERLNRDDPRFAGRMDLSHIGMSGHSFGARTTEGVSGQSLPHAGPRFTDPRIDAAIMFSPSVSKTSDPEEQFADVSIPWMLMTGTEDIAPVGGETLEDRLAVYPALPPGGKYELVLYGAQHSAFTDRKLRPGQPQRNPAHHPDIEVLSTAFWDAYLKGDADTKAWLDGPGPKSILDPKDEWERK